LLSWLCLAAMLYNTALPLVLGTDSTSKVIVGVESGSTVVGVVCAC